MDAVVGDHTAARLGARAMARSGGLAAGRRCDLLCPHSVPSLRSVSWLTLLMLVCVATGIGCATHADRIQPVRMDFAAGDVTAAREKLDKLLKKSRRETDVLKLDRAIVQLADGDPAAAEKTLREVRDRFDVLEGKNLGEVTLAMLTDDNRLAYAGEEYEQVILRSFLAISNLMHDGGDAGAYSLQIASKQQELLRKAKWAEERPELAERQVALGPYIRAALAEESLLDADEAVRARVQVVNWAPEFQQGSHDLERAEYEAPSRPGHGVVYVFALVGRGPYKEETCEVATQVSLLIADRIVSALGEYSVPPTLAPVKVPKLVMPVNRIKRVEVGVDGQTAGSTETLVDIGDYAMRMYEAKYPEIIARAVARRVVKKAAVYGVKEVADVNPWVSLGLDAVGVAWEAAEQADLRCWAMLPAEIQVLRLELPVGEHRLSLTAGDRRSLIGSAAVVPVTVEDGRNSYVLANFPDRELVGRALTSRRRL